MFKKKSLKTILIIFALITAIGVTSSLFGGSRSGKTSSGSSSGGSSGEEHDYSSYGICKDCGYSKAHTRITAKCDVNEEDSSYYLGEFENYNKKCAFLVLFNQGTEKEKGYYVLYDGDYDFTSDVFNSETYLRINEDGIFLSVDSTDFLSGMSDVTVYIADPSVKYVSLNNVYFGDYADQFEITVDGKTVSYDSLVLPLNSKGGSVTIRSLDSDSELYVYEFEYQGNGENEIGCFDGEKEIITYVPSFTYSYISIEA